MRSAAPVPRWLLPLGLFAASLLVYAPSLAGGFVWDDDTNLTDNTAMRGLSGLARIWGEVLAPQYYPLAHTTLWLQYQTTGLATWPYHLVNVALHATTAWLLALVLARLHVRGAALAALLFALDPIHVESVAWITERKNVLSAALGLAAALAYLRFDEARHVAERSAAGDGRRPASVWLAAFALYVLSLLAKSTLSMLPFALLAVLGLLRGRHVLPRPGRVRAAARELLPLVPFFVAGAAAGGFTALVERTRMGATGPEFAWSAPFRLALAGRVFWFYLTRLVVPFDSTFFYPKWTIDAGAALAWVFPLGAIAAAAAAALFRPRTDALLAALLVYLAFVFPALGFFNVYSMRFAYVQNHFAYLAGLPVAAVLAAALTRLLARSRAAGLALSGAFVAAFAVASVRESGRYRDYETLFRTALEHNPAAWVASKNLAFRAMNAGRPAEAARLFQQTLAVRPDDVETVANVGVALAQSGRVGDALPYLARAAALRPDDLDARLNLANALAQGGHAPEAVAEYREAVRLRPAWPRAERELAWLLATTDDPAVRDGAAAVTLAESACAKTTKAIARCNDTLAAAHAAAGDFEAARAAEREAIAGARAAGDVGAVEAYEARARLYEGGSAFVAPRAASRANGE